MMAAITTHRSHANRRRDRHRKAGRRPLPAMATYRFNRFIDITDESGVINPSDPKEERQ
jgi:hypothetical protein